MSCLRVALVCSAPFPAREGIGVHVASLAKQLEARGHEPVLFTRGGLARRVVEPGPPRLVRPRFVPIYPVHVHAHRRPLERALQDEGPFDLLHLHSPLVPVPRLDAPLVATFHTPMAADVGSIGWSEPAGVLARLQLPVSRLLERRLLRAADAITAVSRSAADDLVADHGSAAAGVTVVRNGIDLDALGPKAGKRDPASLLYVGRLAPRKGLQDLVATAGILRDRGERFSLRIVGRGPLEGTLRAQVKAAGLSDVVELPGFLPRTAMLDLLHTSAVFVHLSRYEGLPTSVLEAMACGMAVVTTDAPGTRDAVDHETTGLLVPPGNVRAAADAITSLLRDGALRRRLGEAACAKVVAEHDWRKLGDEMLRVYDRARAHRKS